MSVGTQVTVDFFNQIAGQPLLKVVTKVFKTGSLEEDDIEAEAGDVEMLGAGWYYRLNRAPDGMVVGQRCVTYFYEDQLELDLGMMRRMVMTMIKVLLMERCWILLIKKVITVLVTWKWFVCFVKSVVKVLSMEK